MDAFESDAIASAENILTPHRVEGWMKVLDVGTLRHPSLLILLSARWRRKFCVLQTTPTKTMGQHISMFTSVQEQEAEGSGRDTEQTTLTIGAEPDDSSSYESAKEVPYEEKHVAAGRRSSRKDKKSKTQSRDQHNNDSGYEKPLLKERRGSVPVVVPGVATEESADALSTPNRLMSFISRKSSQLKSNLKRAKSATKLEPKKSDSVVVYGDTSASSPLSSLKRTMSLSRLSRRWHGRPRPGPEKSDAAGDGDQGCAGQPQKIRTSQSHESLLASPANVDSLDLSLPYVQIKPLQSNIFGQEHCFQVSTTTSTKFFACRSAQERQKWIHHLQRTVQPLQDQTHRTDRSLELWILEATNLPVKQRYFCEIYIDDTLYGRTSSKVNGTLLFWAEQFDLNNLPAFKTLRVKLFREGNRNKRKEMNIFIGQVDVPADTINSRQLMESKFSITSSVVGRIGKDAKLSIKARYQHIEILPVAFYQPLLQYVKTEYRPLVRMLESTLLHVREKEELARALVHVMQKSGCAKDFLVDILIDEISKQDNQKVFLRSNSIASKAIDVYMKLVGEKYLRDTLSDFVNMVLNSQQSLEVDSKYLPNGADLCFQKKQLLDSCQTVWFKIFNSQSALPVELKLVFYELRRHLLFKTGDEEVGRQLISSCLFLRFLCPAILSPSLFGLTQVFPQDKDARNLTLIAKVIQGLANFTKFGGGKEEYMIFLNQFVERETSNLKLFLDQISTVDPSRAYPVDDCCFVDLGRELSVLHSLLLESSKILMEKATEDSRETLSHLNQILSDLTEAKNSHSPSQSSKTTRASNDIYRNGCNNVSAAPGGTPLVLETRAPVEDWIDGSNPGSQASTPRFVSNTSFMLTGSTTPSLSSEVNGSFCDIPRTRNTMREMQDSDLYISMTSEKSLPVLPPATFASVLFGSRSHDRPPHASSPTSTSSVNRLMFAAETNSSDFSADVMSMIDSMLSPRESASSKRKGSTSLSHQPGSSAAVGTTVGRQQPLAFANPLFTHPPCARPSQTPPVFPGAGTLPGESDRKHCLAGSANTCAVDLLHHGSASPACVRNTSPSPSLGGGQVPQRTGFLYGCHSHENLPHHPQRVATASSSIHPPNRNSAALAFSDLDSYFATASNGVMSRSMEFPLPPGQPPIGPDSLLKRNNTDSMIVVPRSAPGLVGLDTPPESPTFCSVGYPVGRRNGQMQGTVRMGVRSMQRKLQESEKGKLEYELELRHLRQQLAEMRRKHEQEKAAAVAQVHSEWHQKLRQLENEHRQKINEKDQEISDIKQRLLSSEQQNQHNEATIHDLQLKNLMLQKPRSLAATHEAALDGRQCSTH